MRAYREVLDLATKALKGGATRKAWSEVEWRCHGDCREPFVTTFTGRPERGGTPMRPAGKYRLIGKGAGHVMHVEVWTRCHACPECNAATRRMWTARIMTEFGRCPGRVWMATLTLNPGEAYKLVARGTKRASDRSGTPAGDLALLRAEAGRELTLGLKRLRSATAKPFKFVLVCEDHKSGVPHYHALLFEQARDRPLTWAELDAHVWRLGFRKWKLADAQAGLYVAKYIGKDAGSGAGRPRIRASIGFGQLTA